MTALNSEDSPVYIKLRATIRRRSCAANSARATNFLGSRAGGRAWRESADRGKAYQSFQDDGYVEVRRGVGMFVLAGAAEKLRIAERDHFLTTSWPRIQDHIALLGTRHRRLLERERA